MRAELLIPGMQDHREADLAAEAVVPELEEGPGPGLEEEVQQRPLVGEDQAVELMGQRQDDVEVRQPRRVPKPCQRVSRAGGRRSRVKS